MPRHDLDAAARANDGVLASGEAQALGASRATFHRWLGRPHVTRVAPGVGALADAWASPVRASRQATRLRAALAANPTGALAGRSAAWAWGLVDRPDPLRVLVHHGRDATPVEGVRVVRGNRKLGHEVVAAGRWPVTPVTRTLLDLARELDDVALLAVAVAALRSTTWRPEVTIGLLERHVGMHGSARLERTARRLLGVAPDAASEVLVREALAAAGLPTEPAPRWITTPAGRFQVDVPLRGVPVGVECDSVTFHGDRASLERDHRKSNALAAVGYRLLRISHGRAVGDGLDELVGVARLLVAQEQARAGIASLERVN